MKKVDFCECNFVLGTDKVKEELEKSGEFKVEVHGCLGHCGDCCETQFALVDGDFVSANTSEELIEEIKK